MVRRPKQFPDLEAQTYNVYSYSGPCAGAAAEQDGGVETLRCSVSAPHGSGYYLQRCSLHSSPAVKFFHFPTAFFTLFGSFGASRDLRNVFPIVALVHLAILKTRRSCRRTRPREAIGVAMIPPLIYPLAHLTLLSLTPHVFGAPAADSSIPLIGSAMPLTRRTPSLTPDVDQRGLVAKSQRDAVIARYFGGEPVRQRSNGSNSCVYFSFGSGALTTGGGFCQNYQPALRLRVCTTTV